MFNFSSISFKGSFKESEDLCTSNPRGLDGNFLDTDPDSNLFANTYVESNISVSGQGTNLSHAFVRIASSMPNPEDAQEVVIQKKRVAIKKTSKFKKPD